MDNRYKRVTREVRLRRAGDRSSCVTKLPRCPLVPALVLVLLWIGCQPPPAAQAPEPASPRGGALGAAPDILSVGASNDDTSVVYRLSYAGAHRFFRIYVDTDQSAATGFATRTAGAELLVENGALYRYTGDGRSWAWKLAAAPAYTNTAGQAAWTIARADLGETDPCAERTDLLFDLDDLAAPKLSESYTPSASCQAAVDPTRLTISRPAASNDATGVSYGFDYGGAPAFLRAYVDADQSAATGFAAGAGVGADFLVENGNLWRHGGGGWNWSPMGAVAFGSAAGHASWTVSRSDVGETKPCGEASTLLFQIEGASRVSSAPLPETFTDAGSCAAAPPPPPPSPSPSAQIKYVFVIAMENEPAAAIYGSPSAPYINGELLPKYARANGFADPLPDGIPSEPHYVWMEAGTSQFSDRTFVDDADPSATNSTSSRAHLVAQMGAASPPVSWLSFQEGLDSSTTGACPIRSSGFYGAKHNPFVFFQDVAGSPPSATNAFCADHHRAYTTAAFAQALAGKTVAPYTFITPDACNDMHGASGCPQSDRILAGDQWLRDNLPPLIDFVNANAGVIFIVWDEPVGGSTLIPFLAIGPHVKAGYANAVTYTHSSLTRSVEEIFGLPLLPTVAGASDFADLFVAGFFP
jgi:hypothetical protein